MYNLPAKMNMAFSCTEQIMARQKQSVYVATVTRWSSELRSIESYLAPRQETMAYCPNCCVNT